MVWNGTGTNTIITIINGVNELTEGTFSTFILLLVFGIIYFMAGNEPTREAVAAAAFVTLIIAGLGRVIGFVNDIQLACCFVAMVGSLVMLFNR